MPKDSKHQSALGNSDKLMPDEEVIVRYPLKPRDYLLQTMSDKRAGPDCELGLGAMDVPGKKWVIGDTFLRRYYSIYDDANHKMGFVRSVHPNELASSSGGGIPMMEVRKKEANDFGIQIGGGASSRVTDVLRSMGITTGLPESGKETLSSVLQGRKAPDLNIKMNVAVPDFSRGGKIMTDRGIDVYAPASSSGTAPMANAGAAVEAGKVDLKGAGFM